MDTKTLKCFKVVYQENSMNQAAKRLYITPQGLSRIITKLEEELGTILFERTSKGVFPTESACFLYEKINSLLAQFAEIEHGVKQINRRNTTLRIACACGVFNALSFELIQNFISQHPEVEVEWGEYSNDEVKDLVATFQADVGIAIGNSDKELIAEQKIATRYATALVYEGHAFYEKDEISMMELMQEKIVIMNEQFQIYHTFLQACKVYGFVPDIVAKTADSNFLYKLCQMKAGIGILIDVSTTDFLMKGVRTIPIQEGITWEIYQICSKESTAFPYVKMFQEYVEDSLK